MERQKGKRGDDADGWQKTFSSISRGSLCLVVPFGTVCQSLPTLSLSRTLSSAALLPFFFLISLIHSYSLCTRPGATVEADTPWWHGLPWRHAPPSAESSRSAKCISIYIYIHEGSSSLLCILVYTIIQPISYTIGIYFILLKCVYIYIGSTRRCLT